MGVADRLLLNVVNRRKLGADITRAVDSVSRSGSMEEAPAVVLMVDDPRDVLMESRLLTRPALREVGSPAAAKLRVIDLELDDVTYRLRKARRTGDHVELTLDHFGKVAMLNDEGALSASRSSVTRAQFIRGQVDRIGRKQGPRRRLAFWSYEVNRVMPESAPADSTSPRSEGRSVDSLADGAKAFRGITSLAGYPITAAERRNMAIALGVCNSRKAGPKPTLALCEALVVEPSGFVYPNGKRSAPFSNPPGGDSSSVGPLQLLDSHLNGSTSTDGGRRDFALVCDLFLTKGFTDGVGAIAWAAKNPGASAGQVAQHCQGSAYPARYDAVRSDAEKVIAAGGGIELAGRQGEGGSYLKPYRFKRGKNENGWDNTRELAADVNRRRFITIPRRGVDLFVYAADLDLLRLKPQARIDFDGGYVVDEPEYDLDYNKTVQGIGMTVRADAFEADFASGIPVTIVNAGPADGEYLVWDAQEVDGSPDVELELRMPQLGKAEPASEVVSRTDDADYDVRGDDSPPMKVYRRALAISDRNYPYVWGGGHARAGQPSGGGYDCSGYTTACLEAADAIPDAWRTSGVPASGTMAASYGLPGEGKYITLWVNSGHAFLELKLPGKKGRWADTSTQAGGPSGPHVRYGKRSTAGFTPRHWRGL